MPHQQEGADLSLELRILSAGAVKPGLTKVIDAFRTETGQMVKVSFATAPAILKRVGAGESADVVIAPSSVLDELTASGNISLEGRIALGRIGVGLMVRDGTPVPKITTLEEFKDCLLSADSIVYNQASTGTYMDALFDRLGLASELKAKSTRYPDFAAVLDHVSRGSGREIGVGATTVITENESSGVKLVGPLPQEIQNYTTYVAAMVAAGNAKANAQHFVRYLSSPQARSILAAAGIEE
jgi:molybdate transport system substrate-binding protein